MINLRRRSMLAGAAAATLGAAAIANAQTDWPKGPIKLIVPFPPGGSTDPIARLIQAGRHLSKEGIDEILAIRRDMNDGGAKRRKYSDDSIHGLFEPGESSETARQASTTDEVVEDDTVRSA